MLIALAGSLWVSALAVARSLRFRRTLRMCGQRDPELERRVTRLAARMSVGRVPRSLSLDSRVSPMIWGALGRSVLVIPARLLRELSEPELDTLIAHELGHLRRRDPGVRLLELAVVALYWWLPLAWWARQRLRRAEERCCDALVTRHLPADRRAYADCLLKTLRYLTLHEPPRVALASGLGNTHDLEGRLNMIMTRRTSKRLPASLRLPLVAAALAALVVFPALVRESTAEEEAPAPAQEARALGDVLRSIAALNDLNFVIDPSIDLARATTIEIDDAHWKESLQRLLAETGLGARSEGDIVWISAEDPAKDLESTFSGKPLDLDLQNVDLREALKEFATVSGLDIVLEDGIEARVTVALQGVPWDQALDAIARINNLETSIEDGVVRLHRPRTTVP